MLPPADRLVFISEVVALIKEIETNAEASKEIIDEAERLLESLRNEMLVSVRNVTTETVDSDSSADVRIETLGNMLDFLFKIPRGKQGERGEVGIGEKGDTGEDGFSPVITVAEQTATTYRLAIETATDAFETPNLRGQNGFGSGDMLKSVYDKQSKEMDIYTYTDDAISPVSQVAGSALTAAGVAATAASEANTAAGNALSRANEAFTSASEGKSVLAGAIGSPSTAIDTFPTMAVRINTSKNTLAENLTAKGVTATATEPLQALVEKVAEIKVGGGYSKIEEIAILASGNYVIPDGVIMYDAACLGAGGGGATSGSKGAGGAIFRAFGVLVEAGQVFAVVIGAGGAVSANGLRGGDTTFGVYTAAGGYRLTSVANTAVTIWGVDNTSPTVGGSGSEIAGNDFAYASDNVMAGGAYAAWYTSTGTVRIIPARPNFGGGGSAKANSSGAVSSVEGSSGRVQLRLYYE